MVSTLWELFSSDRPKNHLAASGSRFLLDKVASHWVERVTLSVAGTSRRSSKNLFQKTSRAREARRWVAPWAGYPVGATGSFFVPEGEPSEFFLVGVSRRRR